MTVNRYSLPWVVPAIVAVPPPREFESDGISKQKRPALAGLMRHLPIPAIATSGTKPELSDALYRVPLVLDSGAGLPPRH